MMPLLKLTDQRFPKEKDGRHLVKILEEQVKFLPWIMQLQATEYERPPPVLDGLESRGTTWKNSPAGGRWGSKTLLANSSQVPHL